MRASLRRQCIYSAILAEHARRDEVRTARLIADGSALLCVVDPRDPDEVAREANRVLHLAR